MGGASRENRREVARPSSRAQPQTIEYYTPRAATDKMDPSQSLLEYTLGGVCLGTASGVHFAARL